VKELIGKHFVDLIQPDYLQNAAGFYELQLTKKIQNTFYEFPAVTKDGTALWLAQNVQLMMENGRIVGFQAVARDITKRIQMEERVRRFLEQQIAVNQLALALGETRDLDKMYRIVYEHVRALMDAGAFIVSFYNSETQLIRAGYVVIHGSVCDVASFLPIPLEKVGHGLQSQVIHTGEPLYTPDWRKAMERTRTEYKIAGDGAVSQGPPPEEQEDSARSALSIPMKIEGETIGVIQVQSHRLDAYRQEDIDLCYAMASVAAIAIQNARLYEAVQQELAERKRAEEALRRSEERYRAVAETAIAGIGIADSEENLTLVNPAFAKMLGYTQDELTGMNLSQLLDQGEIARYQELTQVGRERVSSCYETTLRRKDGKALNMLVSASPLTVSDGSFEGSLAVVLDITERKALEMQLAQAQKLEAIGQLAAGIAHEINTPIQYVGDNTRFLQDSFADMSGLVEKYHCLLEAARVGSAPPELVAAVEKAIDEADMEYLSEEIPVAIQQSLEGIARVAKIVRAMREFSHPGVEEKTTTDINKAIESTITVARNEWKYVAEMETDFDSELPLVLCLPGEFNQVILNLLVNAAHAIADVVGDGSEGKEPALSPKGTITVSTHCDGDWAKVRISDTGMGIPEEVRPRIFDPFFTTKEVGKGTGQGLAIAHNVVVEKHGGTITFETKVGKGTTFIIRLPINSVPQREIIDDF